LPHSGSPLALWQPRYRHDAGRKTVRLSDQQIDKDERDLACAILRYLNKHPDSKDTLEGIAQWWLLREWAERQIADVEKAVSLLISRQLVVGRQRGEQQPVYYELNRGKKEEIARLLNESCKPKRKRIRKES
jgi:hypothetical protein